MIGCTARRNSPEDMKSLAILVFASFSYALGHTTPRYQSWVSDPRNSLYPDLPNVAPESEDELCRSHSQMFLDALEAKTLWASQMWDATAKGPVGVLSGNIFHYGNYEECLKIPAPFRVQYCLGHVFAKVSLNYYDFRATNEASVVWTHLAKSRMNPAKVPRDMLGWGLCVPESCKPLEMQNTINSHLEAFAEEFYNDTIFKIMIDDTLCTKNDFLHFTPGEIAFWVVLFSLIILTSTSTFMDLVSKKKESKRSKVYNLWMLFSIKQNYPELVPMGTRTKSPLSVFHGIKFFSMLVVIYGHRIGIALSLSAINYDNVEDFFIHEHKMFFLQSDLVVDTFFFISGLLACYVMADVLSKRSVNPLKAIAVRFFRLAPMYFFVIWFQATAAYRLGNGPMWKALAKNETQYCVDHWWTNVLFVSNYIDTREMCMPHSWFLACEMQFFVLAAFLVPILVKYGKWGRIFFGAVTAGFIITPAVTIYLNKAPALILFYYGFFSQPRKDDTFNNIYIKGHNRVAVYLIGIAVGLFLHYSKDWKSKISRKLTLCGVLGWFAFMFAPMAYGGLFYDSAKPYNLIEAAVFGGVRRISWAIGFSIFITAHRFGTIPVIDVFFSTKPAVFLSRITYGIYLVHFSLVTSTILANKSQNRFSIHEHVVRGFADVVESGIASIIMIFIIEIPLRRLFRDFILPKKMKQLERPPEVQNVFTVRL